MKESKLTVYEHFEELRRRILISLAAVAAGAIAGYASSDYLLEILVITLKSQTGQLFFFSPQGAFVVKIKLALFAGFIAALPVVLHQLWLFLSPALRGHEKKAVFPLVFITTFLFIAGALFAWFMVFPVAMKFLVGM